MLGQVTDRESEVLELLATGMPNKAIATALGVTERTVKAHMSSLLLKTRLASRVELLLWWQRARPMLPPPRMTLYQRASTFVQ